MKRRLSGLGLIDNVIELAGESGKSCFVESALIFLPFRRSIGNLWIPRQKLTFQGLLDELSLILRQWLQDLQWKGRRTVELGRQR